MGYSASREMNVRVENGREGRDGQPAWGGGSRGGLLPVDPSSRAREEQRQQLLSAGPQLSFLTPATPVVLRGGGSFCLLTMRSVFWARRAPC